MQRHLGSLRGKAGWAMLFGGTLFGLIYVIAKQQPDFDPWDDY